MDEDWKVVLQEVCINLRSAVDELSDHIIVLKGIFHLILYVGVFDRLLLVNYVLQLLDDSLESPDIEKSSLSHCVLFARDLDLLGMHVEVLHVYCGDAPGLHLIKNVLCKIAINFVLLKNCYFLYTLRDLLHDSSHKRLNLLLFNVASDDL